MIDYISVFFIILITLVCDRVWMRLRDTWRKRRGGKLDDSRVRREARKGRKML